MQDYLYTAMNGARHSLASQQVHANNLANSSTNGFKKDMVVAESFHTKGAGFQTQATVKTERSATSFDAGTLQSTGRDLDVSVHGKGFISVIDAQGNEAYTRSGSMQLDANGQAWINGYQVMGAGGPLVIPDSAGLSIGSNGQVSTSVPGGGTAQVDQLKLVQPEISELTKGPDGLFRSQDGAPFAQNPDVQLMSKHLESSNVNPVDEMVANMALTRNFELQVKMMKSADENSAAGNKLIRGS